jgi:hypothetical protein
MADLSRTASRPCTSPISNVSHPRAESGTQSNPRLNATLIPLFQSARPLMAACPKSRPQNRKRQHAEADLSQDDLPSLPSKKFKSTREHHSASNFPPAFWDSLSKVWLTRRALRELDRRNQLKSSACVRAPAHKPVRPSSNRKDLQRFARLGGPELGDLRGVRLNCPYCIVLPLTMPV